MQAHLSNQPPILRVEDLTVAYRRGDQIFDAVRDITFQINYGQIYGLVGESGSGKTTIAMAIMRYLGENGIIRKGLIEFSGKNLIELDSTEMRQLWGSHITLVPQNPLSALNPSIRVGEQLAEIIRHHIGLYRNEIKLKVYDLLKAVRLPDPERIANSYPHQISGGMQQRILIAMAISTSPRLIILDEPTTSLDVTTQASILDLLQELIGKLGTSALYVTHNMGVVAQICDHVAVLYAGELVEEAPLDQLFQKPLHPYTRGLLESVPRMGINKKRQSLKSIKGQIPPLGDRPDGCVFSPRCNFVLDLCSQRPAYYLPEFGRKVRCHRWEEMEAGKLRETSEYLLQEEPEFRVHEQTDINGGRETILELENLKVYFDVDRSFRDVINVKPVEKLKAVDGVTLMLTRGATLGLVGESGSGKTTIARAIVGLINRTGGDIKFIGDSLPPSLSKRSLETLRKMQLIFQNPEEALNPYYRVGSSLRNPLFKLRKMSRADADRTAKQLLSAVKLPGDYADRMPGQLSGGEKQRIAIARAYATNPDLLLADEPVSSLDVSVRASILNLLKELQREHGRSLFFVSHDLAVIDYIADIIAVIYLGNIMEIGQAEFLFEPPFHPYTEALLSAVPVPDPQARGVERIRLPGDIPSPVDVPAGCPFHTRCPRFLGQICETQTPTARVDDRGKQIYCHIQLEELHKLQGHGMYEKEYRQ